jgi:hypothetical protein
MVLVAVILAIAAISLFMGKALKKEGNSVVVSLDGAKVAEYSLGESGTYELSGYDGGYNTLVIEEGVAYLTDADCPDKLCVKQGKISKVGETIVCLPHRIVIEVVGEGEAEIDAVSK